MESNPKIIVLQLKEIIYTLLFIILGIFLLVLLIYTFMPKNKDKESLGNVYNAGTYTSAIDVGATTLEVVVTVDSNRIKDISMNNLSDDIATMYPLLKPSLEDVSRQVIELQSTNDIQCNEENLYTCTVLVSGINSALEKAKLP